MAREFFKNLPNTTTPLTAPRMNALLDGDEAMGNVVVDSIRSKNLFNKSDLVDGHYIDADGTIGNSSSFCYTGLIPVELASYIISGSFVGGSWQMRIHGYNQSGTWVEQIKAQAVGTTTITSIPFTVSNNSVKYIRISMTNNTNYNNFNIMQIEKGTSATDYSEYKGLGYVSGSNSNGNYIKYDDGTLIQWGTIAKNGFLQPTDYYDTVQGIRWYRSEVANQTFPISFVNNTYSITPSIQNGSTGCRLLTHRIADKTQSSFSIQLIGVENFQSSGNAYVNLTGIDWTAEGRWK